MLSAILNEAGFIEGFTAVPNYILEQLISGALSAQEMQVLLAIIKKTLGRQKRVERIKLKEISEMTNLRIDSVCKRIKTLTRKGFIFKRKIANRLHLGLRKPFLEKEETKEKQKASFLLGKSKKLKKKPEFSQKTVPDKGNTSKNQKNSCRKDSSLNIQANKDSPSCFNTCSYTTKDFFQKNYLQEEVIPDIIANFKSKFIITDKTETNDSWTPEEIIAADYMLQLLDEGKLGSIKNIKGYLTALAKNIAKAPPENLIPWKKRLKRRIEAERKYKERLKMEAIKQGKYLEFKAKITTLAEEIFKSLSDEEKTALSLQIKKMYPNLSLPLLKKRILKWLEYLIESHVIQSNSLVTFQTLPFLEDKIEQARQKIDLLNKRRKE